MRPLFIIFFKDLLLLNFVYVCGDLRHCISRTWNYRQL